MGINTSKLAEKVPEDATLEEQAQDNPGNTNVEEQGSIPSTPILTPKIIRENIEKDNLDPRSPSKHIARTPIELLPAAVETLKSLTLENIGKEQPVETPLKKHVLLGIDPRSPTLEFQRTPIVVSSSPDKKLPAKIRNKNLDKVLKCALPNTPKDKKIIPPKLLESCPVTPKPKSDAYKRKSFVLLETNVDFTETDLDNVIKQKYLGKSLQNLCTSYSELNDPRSPTTDFLRTPIQIGKKVEDSDKIISQTSGKHSVGNKIQNEEISVNMDKLSTFSTLPEATIPVNKNYCDVKNIPIAEVNDQNFTESELNDCNRVREESEQHEIPSSVSVNEPVLAICVTKTEEIIMVTPCRKSSPTTRQKLVLSPILKHETQYPKSAPVSPPSVVSVTPKKSKSQPVTPPFIDLTADVKELDKKLTHLIYEDEKDLIVCPRIVKVKDQNRTPLGLRNGTENKKSTQKLKVSDKPRKAEYIVSKIPVFKEKKIKVQCENTPPRGMRPKKSHWDAKDDTLVI